MTPPSPREAADPSTAEVLDLIGNAVALKASGNSSDRIAGDVLAALVAAGFRVARASAPAGPGQGGDVATRLRATRAVCADREAELLALKGPCSDDDCTLHYAHRGPHADRPAAAPSAPGEAAETEGGPLDGLSWTTWHNAVTGRDSDGESRVVLLVGAGGGGQERQQEVARAVAARLTAPSPAPGRPTETGETETCPCCLGDPGEVCSECGEHACWAGRFMCDASDMAGTRQADLPTLGRGDTAHVRWLDRDGYHYARGKVVPVDEPTDRPVLPARVLDVPGAPSPLAETAGLLAETAGLLGCTPDQVPARVRGLLDEQRGGGADPDWEEDGVTGWQVGPVDIEVDVTSQLALPRVRLHAHDGGSWHVLGPQVTTSLIGALRTALAMRQAEIARRTPTTDRPEGAPS